MQVKQKVNIRVLNDTVSTAWKPRSWSVLLSRSILYSYIPSSTDEQHVQGIGLAKCPLQPPPGVTVFTFKLSHPGIGKGLVSTTQFIYC